MAQPIASFTISETSVCVGDTITMTSTSVAQGAPIVNYIWSAQGAIIESGQGSNMTTFSFVYSVPGTYNLSLIVQDQNGQSSNSFVTNAIQVFANPSANFTFSSLSCQEPFQLNFSNAGSSTGANFLSSWTFVDGSPGTFIGNQTNVSFANEGQYSALLRVTDQTTGCYSEKLQVLNLSSFIADFSVPLVFCKNQTYLLSDLSTSGANLWSWSSSGGTISGANSQNPSITFTAAGTYTITLNASNTNASCSDNISKTITVLDLPSPSFTSNGTFGCAPKTISFSNTSTNQGGASFVWSFGDGQVFAGNSPPPHVYQSNNNLYFPSLTMTSSNGCSNTIVGDTIYLFPPEAAFSFSKADGCAPSSVNFSDASYSPEPIVSWFWNFDDGGLSGIQNPSHTFLQCGIYDVRLIIVTQSGCRDTTYVSDQVINMVGGSTYATVSDEVLVETIGQSAIYRDHNDLLANNFRYDELRFGETFTPDFSYTPAVGCASEHFTFTSSIAPPCIPDDDILYYWDYEGFGSEGQTMPVCSKVFGDTLQTSSPMDVSHYVDFRGCISDTVNKEDIIYLKGPVSNFQTSGLFCNMGPGPHSISIIDTFSIYGHQTDQYFNGIQVVTSQTNDDVEVFYDWGDSTTSSITDDALLEDADKGGITHVYTGYGSYNIKQIIYNYTTGCSDSSFQTVNISFVDASLFTDSVCELTRFSIDASLETPESHLPLNVSISNQTQTFTSSSLNSETLYSLPYNQNQNPNLYFVEPNSGIDTFTFIVWNNLGCSDTLIKTVRVLELPQAVITVDDDTICNHADLEYGAYNSIFGDYPSWLQASWIINNNNVPLITQVSDSLSTPVTNSLTLSLQVTDSFGCKSQNVEQITIHTQGPNASFTNDQYLCNDVLTLIDGSASSGNQLNYQWYLNQDSIPNSNTDSLFHAINVVPEDLLFNNYMYSLVVTDNKNCSDSIAQSVFVSNPRITLVNETITSTFVDVNGNYTCPPVYVDFSLSYQTNFTADNYQWSFGNDFDTDFDSYNANPLGIQYVQAGSYNLFVQMEESVTGCIFSYEEEPFLTIGGPQAEIIITSDTNSLCGMTYLFQLINPSDNLDHWSWDLGDGTVVSSDSEPDNTFTHTYLDVNDFFPVITIFDDSSQCGIPISKTIEAFENGLHALFEFFPDEPVVELDMTFNDLSTNDNNTPIVSWIWDFGDGDSLIMSSNANVNHIYLTDTAQFVTLTIFDEYGCTDQYTLPIDLFKVNFLIPNIITNPGWDGVNSVFTLFEDIFIDFEIVIVNRWGNVVYKGLKNLENPLYLWNGRNYKTDEICSDGVYFFTLNGTLKNGKPIKYQSFLTLAGKKY